MQRAKTVKRIKTIINSVGAPPPVQQAPTPQAPLDFLQNMEKGMDAFLHQKIRILLKDLGLSWIVL